MSVNHKRCTCGICIRDATRPAYPQPDGTYGTTPNFPVEDAKFEGILKFMPPIAEPPPVAEAVTEQGDEWDDVPVALSAFEMILDEMRDLHRKKSADYGSGEDPLANIRASERFGIPAWVGAVIRGNDKMSRIISFVMKGKLENESIEDSLMDLAVYSMIALQLYREQKANGTQPL